MNSLKVLVNSLDELYPKKNEYKITPEYENEMPNNGNNDIDESGELGERYEKHTEGALQRSTYVAFIIQAVFFLPNYLIVKPLTFIWLLTTYPFTHLFKQHSIPEGFLGNEHGDRNPSPDNDSMPSAIDEKTELLKQENIMANNIKSPTSSSKYIIPPPQRLYPLSRNPGKKRRRKTLILDLDETLIHSLSRGSPRSFRGGSTHTIEIKINNISSLYYVHKRPYCDFFLKEVAKWFDLQIFTASVKEYADPIIDWLESDISTFSTNNQDIQQRDSQVFTKRYYRTDCTYRPGVGYIKDLSKFFPREDDLKNVIILDNSPISYALHEDNAVMIEGWINDQSDRDLLNLLPMLHSLSLCIDVRFILALRSGEKVFEN